MRGGACIMLFRILLWLSVPLHSTQGKKAAWLGCSFKAPEIGEEMEDVQFHLHLKSFLGNPLVWASLYLQALIRNPKPCAQDLIIKMFGF